MSTTAHIQAPCLTSTADIIIRPEIYANGIDSFSNLFCNAMYEFGRLLTTPWSAGIGKAVQLWNSPSGEKVQAVMLGFLLIISSPLAIPGLLLRLGFYSFRNPFAFKPARDSEGYPSSFSILSWNVALNPKFISAANHLRNPEERVNLVLGRIMEQKPFVICLQGVYDLDAIKAMEKFLTENSYDCIHSVNPTGIGLNSGLFVAVKRTETVKVERVASWQFNNLSNKDYFSNKGMIGIRLRLTNESSKQVTLLNIFNTHLQASYGNKGYSQVRQAQVASILHTIQDWTIREPSEVALFGDFNFAANPLEPGDLPTEYNEQIGAIQRILPTAYLNQEGRVGTYIDPKTKIDHNKTCNFAFTTQHFSPSPAEFTVILKGNPEKGNVESDLHASDHRPVVWSYSPAQSSS